jgi:DNA-directed RNA polymerase beta' subunit
MGWGRQEFMGALQYERYGLADTGVRTCRLEGRNRRWAPVLEDLRRDFDGIQDGSEGLWNTRTRVARGIGYFRGLLSRGCGV